MKSLKHSSQHGFTLLELIIFILLAGLVMPVIIGMFTVGFKDRDVPVITVKAGLLAEGMLAEMSTRLFDENSALQVPPYSGTEVWTYQPDLGLDAGESFSVPSSLDDVDDYIGYTKIVPDGELGDFTVSVPFVYYVDDDLNNDALDTELVGEFINTDFKRVTIRVSHSMLGDQDFVSLFATEAGR